MQNYVSTTIYNKAGKNANGDFVTKYENMNIYNTTYSKQYAQGLEQIGFDFHNILRMSQRVYNNYFEQWEHHNFKSTIKRIDYYMRNLVRHRDIKTVFVCIEPDIDQMTGKVDPTSNNVHFAWKGKELSRGHLANAMKSKRMYLRDNWKMVDNHSYFTKHLGTNLSYHNIYV